jgi:flagellar motility protein MotE (MotC chaperone)
MMRILQTKWMAVTVGTVSYALTTWLCLQPQKQFLRAAEALRATGTVKATAPAGPSWTFQNPELNHLMGELKVERETLRSRATQLDELEARLSAERQEICLVTQTVFRLRKELDATVNRVTDEEAVNLKKLAKVYATMSPTGAARILKEMDDDQIVKILSLMKEAETAPLLESFGQSDKLDVKRAALISNRLRLTIPPLKKAPAP